MSDEKEKRMVERNAPSHRSRLSLRLTGVPQNGTPALTPPA